MTVEKSKQSDELVHCHARKCTICLKFAMVAALGDNGIPVIVAVSSTLDSRNGFYGRAEQIQFTGENSILNDVTVTSSFGSAVLIVKVYFVISQLFEVIR